MTKYVYYMNGNGLVMCEGCAEKRNLQTGAKPEDFMYCVEEQGHPDFPPICDYCNNSILK